MNLKYEIEFYNREIRPILFKSIIVFILFLIFDHISLNIYAPTETTKMVLTAVNGDYTDFNNAMIINSGYSLTISLLQGIVIIFITTIILQIILRYKNRKVYENKEEE